MQNDIVTCNYFFFKRRDVASCAVINEQREWKAAPQDTYAETIQIEKNDYAIKSRSQF